MLGQSLRCTGRETYDLVEAFGGSQAGWTSPNDQNVDMSEILLSANRAYLAMAAAGP